MKSHVSSPSIGRKFLQNAQDVRFSDDATWMSHRNGGNFLKRAGNKNEPGRLSFAYFSLAKQRKVWPAAGETYLSFDNGTSIPGVTFLVGPSALGLTSKSKISVGNQSVAQALGISTTPLI